MLVEKQKEEVKKKGSPSSKVPFLIICYNCEGKGHAMKFCTSASRVVSKKIERKKESVEKGKKKLKMIDDDSFTKVVNS